MKQAGKVIIIGAGHVGSHAAYALASQGLAGEIVLIDIDREKAAAQALDIGDAAAYLPAGLRCIMGRGGTSMELNLEGIAVGAASLLVIGAFHPLVIWCEYHFSQKIWPLFLLCGLICLGLALFAHGLLSILLGLVGVAFLWSIRELKEQARRVERGWFPQNPKRT